MGIRIARKISHTDLINVAPDQHHAQYHKSSHLLGGSDGFSQAAGDSIELDTLTTRRIFRLGLYSQIGNSLNPFLDAFIQTLWTDSGIDSYSGSGYIPFKRRLRFPVNLSEAGAAEGDVWYRSSTGRLAWRDATTVREALRYDERGAALGVASLDVFSLVPPDQLGTGSPDSTTFLRGDRTWATPPSGGGAGGEVLVAHWTRNVTKTNIGTSFVDIYTDTGSDGLPARVDFTGRTQVAAVVLWNKVGTGVQTVRAIDADNPANVLFSMDVISGRNVFPGLNLPPANLPAWATGVKYIKLQAKSTVGTDDPVFLGCNINLK